MRDLAALEMTVLMSTDMADFSGKVHGGASPNLLDRVAFSYASRHSQKHCVTLSVVQVRFLQPIYVGELLGLKTRINITGRSAMEVGIHVSAENIRSGEQRHTNTCFFAKSLGMSFRNGYWRLKFRNLLRWFPSRQKHFD